LDTSRASRISLTLGLPGEKLLLLLLAADCRYHGSCCARADRGRPASDNWSCILASSAELWRSSKVTFWLLGNAGVLCRIVFACSAAGASCRMRQGGLNRGKSGKEGKQNTGTTLTFCGSSGGLGLCARVRARMGAGGPPNQSAQTRSPESEASSRMPPVVVTVNFTSRAVSGELNSSLARPTAPLPSPRWYQWYQCAALSSWSGAGWCALGVARPEGLSSELRLGLNNPPLIGPCRRGALRGGKKSSTGGIFGDERG
jgi:hypothetical protein